MSLTVTKDDNTFYKYFEGDLPKSEINVNPEGMPWRHLFSYFNGGIDY